MSMIRTIYRWQVKPGCEGAFVKAWLRGTQIIRATVKGARGSVLLRNHTNPSAFQAIAWWDSFEAWWAFRQGALLDREAFRIASTVSDLHSVEAFYEMRDLGVPQVPEARGWTQVFSPAVAEALAA
jgi:heme-degrading monooxygenase HmoA